MPKPLKKFLKKSQIFIFLKPLVKDSKILSKYLGKEYLELYVSAKEGEFEHMDNSFIPSEEYDFYL